MQVLDEVFHMSGKVNRRSSQSNPPRPPRTQKEVKSKSLALTLQKCCAQLGLNPRQLSAQMGYAYDPIRKIYNGTEFAGLSTLKDLCAFFSLNFEETKREMKHDQALYKGMLDDFFTREDDQYLAEMRPYWKYLKESDKEFVLQHVKFIAEKAIRN